MSNTIKIIDTRILSDYRYLLKQVTFSVNGEEEQKKEVYTRSNSATVLLYNTQQKTVVLIRQLRLPTYLNGNEDGMLVECCAGTMDTGETAEECIRREAIEEIGYELQEMEKMGEAYVSPASVTEMVTLFIAPYTPEMRIADGGGLKEEHEDIEVLEMSFEKAFSMMESGAIRDAKTIMLLQYLKMRGVM
jgi:nudix-type nucleoside diphosphatase (YffH/AdpP family)